MCPPPRRKKKKKKAYARVADPDGGDIEVAEEEADDLDVAIEEGKLVGDRALPPAHAVLCRLRLAALAVLLLLVVVPLKLVSWAASGASAAPAVDQQQADTMPVPLAPPLPPPSPPTPPPPPCGYPGKSLSALSPPRWCYHLDGNATACHLAFVDSPSSSGTLSRQCTYAAGRCKLSSGEGVLCPSPPSSPPPPPSPPPLPSPPPPPPFQPPQIWTRHAGKNCFWDGNGAIIDLDPTPAPGVASLEECKSLCVATLLCEGLLFSNQGQCYRKGDVQVGRCRTDRRFDLYVYVLASPPSPPLPPFPPDSEAVRAINQRFRSGGPSDKLTEVGILLHQWDGLEANDEMRPYKMCVEKCTTLGREMSGRVSAMAVYQGLKDRPDRVGIPLPFGNRGGLVLDGAHVTLECLFGIDGASYMSDDARRPGCTRTFCDRAQMQVPNVGLCGFAGYPPQAWGPADLKLVLETHRGHGAPYTAPAFHSGYNELVLNARKLNEQLPHAVSAFFLLRGRGGEYEGEVTDDLDRGVVIDVVRAHRAFLAEYHLTADEVPLLVLDPMNWERPFTPYVS